MSANTDFDWTVIGAGPAGIAVIGQLIDSGVNPKHIAWIDPCFKVGDFGTKWRKVPSNTKVGLFLKFLNACQSFHYAECTENFALHTLDPEKTCQLHYMADPLQWVTEQLKKQVHCVSALVKSMQLTHRHWEISSEDGVVYSKNVVLATGSEPKTLSLAQTEIIPLDVTFDPERLAEICKNTDTIAVFGSSHSAILIIRNLLEHCKVKKVINFYQSPLVYAIYLDNEILFDDTGLKGTTADWARENIDGSLPENLTRVISSKETMDQHLGECTKSVHAVGFTKRSLHIEGISELKYDDKTGIIAPGLFGFGIAFPEAKINRFGTTEHRVGLWKFMEYLKRVMPVWMKYNA